MQLTKVREEEEEPREKEIPPPPYLAELFVKTQLVKVEEEGRK